MRVLESIFGTIEQQIVELLRENRPESFQRFAGVLLDHVARRFYAQIAARCVARKIPLAYLQNEEFAQLIEQLQRAENADEAQCLEVASKVVIQRFHTLFSIFLRLQKQGHA